MYCHYTFLSIADAFLEKIPKSPVRELLEMEPETAKFEWVVSYLFNTNVCTVSVLFYFIQPKVYVSPKQIQ